MRPPHMPTLTYATVIVTGLSFNKQTAAFWAAALHFLNVLKLFFVFPFRHFHIFQLTNQAQQCRL